MSTRPRRDWFNSTIIYNDSCSESGRGFILIVNDLQDLFDYMFNTEIITAFMSPQASFLIYFIRGINCDQDQSMRRVFENLWRVYKTPHVIITGMECESVVFYNPFLNWNENWGEMFAFQLEQISEKPELIQNEMLTFNQYPIKPVLFPCIFTVNQTGTGYTGININVLNLLSDYAKFSIEFVYPPEHEEDKYGYKSPNGTLTGALGRLVDGLGDLIIVDYFIKDYSTQDLEFSVSPMTDNMCVIVKRAELIPEWQLLYHCLDRSTWISIVIVYFIMTCTWFAIKRILNIKSDSIVFLDTFRVVISSALYHPPETVPERIFLSFCLLGFITLVGAFQGSLVGVYTTPVFYKNPDTLKDLAKSNVVIITGFLELMDTIFGDVTNPTILELKRKIRFHNETISITQKILEQSNYATLVRKSEFEVSFETTTYYDEHNLNLIHMVKECAICYNVAYLFPVNSPYAPRFNAIVLQIAEAGLFGKWYEEMAFNASNKALRHSNVMYRYEGSQAFRLKDMQISFYQLISGLVLASVCFFVEILIHNVGHTEILS